MLMPPPMSLVQLPLPHSLDEPPSALNMYGNTLLAIAGDYLVRVENASKVDSVKVSEWVDTREVYRVIAYKKDIKSDEIIVILIEN